ncbi:MAG: cytochrome c [Flavobacteriia bacterium]|nr:cytochrome c [Flavobacteriia bacterium]
MAFQSKFRWGLVLMFAGLSACTESSPEGYMSSEKVPSGKHLFQLHCAACHGNDGALGVSGAKNLKTSKLPLSDVKDIINNGKNGMPAFKGILTEKPLVDSLTHYVLTLRN